MEAATRYTDSKGRKIEIAEMPRPHLVFAHDKAVRTEAERLEADPAYVNEERAAEITAMKARIDQLDAEYAEQQAAEQAAQGDAAEEG